MSEVLHVEPRRPGGKRDARRLRRAGSIPGILYGHGQDALSIQASSEALHAVVRHGSRVVDLAGAASEKAFLRELQWDVYGAHVLHFDLTRVSEDEKVEVEVPVELRGEALGVKEGGVVTQLVHHVNIECLVLAIPEKLTLRVHGLTLGGSLAASQIELPPGTTLLLPPETIVAQCALPKVEEEEAAPAAEGAEPELIGRKPGEEEEEE
jgi:large subunit ribosomal protein L25